MDHIKTAYNLGARLAQLEFAKQAEPALGDPSFWQGGEQAQQQQQPPATAEDAAMSLPTGTFQGLTTRLSPEGERSTSVKVTPDALGVPDNLAAIFQAEPTAKVEVAQPQAKGEGAGQQDLGIPSNLPGSPPPDPLAEPKTAGLPSHLRQFLADTPEINRAFANLAAPTRDRIGVHAYGKDIGDLLRKAGHNPDYAAALREEAAKELRSARTLRSITRLGPVWDRPLKAGM